MSTLLSHIRVCKKAGSNFVKSSCLPPHRTSTAHLVFRPLRVFLVTRSFSLPCDLHINEAGMGHCITSRAAPNGKLSTVSHLHSYPSSMLSLSTLFEYFRFTGSCPPMTQMVLGGNSTGLKMSLQNYARKLN